MNSASVSWSSTPDAQSDVALLADDLGTRLSGSTIQPSRSPGPGTCSPSRNTRPARGRGPGARRRAGGRSGTPRRSRPPGSARPCRAPSRPRPPPVRGAAPRPSGTGAPVSAAPRPLRLQLRTAQRLGPGAAFVEGQRGLPQPRVRVSSVPVEVEPVRLDGHRPHPPRPQHRARAASARGWNPEQITIRSGSAYTPRARAR